MRYNKCMPTTQTHTFGQRSERCSCGAQVVWADDLFIACEVELTRDPEGVAVREAQRRVAVAVGDSGLDEDDCREVAISFAADLRRNWLTDQADAVHAAFGYVL